MAEVQCAVARNFDCIVALAAASVFEKAETGESARDAVVSVFALAPAAQLQRRIGQEDFAVHLRLPGQLC